MRQTLVPDELRRSLLSQTHGTRPGSPLRPMSNVVPFRRPKAFAQRAGCDVVSVADDLLAVLDEVQDLAARAAEMQRPAIEVERTVQNLLDALSALERAVDCIGEGSGSMPA